MKFGKHLKASATAGWVYLDYKALKKLLKQLQALPESSDQREGAERRFMCVPPAKPVLCACVLVCARLFLQRRVLCAQGGAVERHRAG